ncbi:MAG: hypothetical protein L7F78_27960 [Syntrophales bacterium LBB04]|nr:hypothetical protein [Syntrophales bacterium LBB04]
MTILQMIEYLRKNSGLLKVLFYVLLGAIVLLDIFLPREGSHYLMDRTYAFWTFFTLAGCFLLIKVSKAVAHIFLAKDEDYYG